MTATSTATQPWYQRALRWGQTNITELDATRYDIDWWRAYWRRTHVQGVILNAGGIVAYYPSDLPLQYRAEHLGDRDLYGELTAAARAEGLFILARMDSNRTTEDFYVAHPDWFTRDNQGQPYRAGGRYVTCIFSDYYDAFLPAILREIAERYQPEGFTDNSWSGLGRSDICYCANCTTKFKAATGFDLPAQADWESPVYRAWIRWNYDRRIAVWDLNTQVVQAAGGADCLWLGMNSANIHSQSQRFRDLKRICERAPIMMMDHQRRSVAGFQENGHAGKLIHGLLGWDKLAPESMAQYQAGTPTFRVGSKPAVEARFWMLEGFAGGIQPWWHFISAYHEDRRQYRTSPPVMAWHAANDVYLVNRRPVATVGLVWSQDNVDFFGRDEGHDRVMLPHYGMTQALIRARVPYLPVHADHIARDAGDLSVLILPNMGAMSEQQVQAVRDFVAAGGSLIASGESSLYTEWGERREEFALADLLGVQAMGEALGGSGEIPATWESFAGHTYLRIHPELRAGVDGPHTPDEPIAHGARHPVLAGFEETDILPFGGRLELVQAASDRETPLTLIPAFPIYPPEFAWMRQMDSVHPGLVLSQTSGGGRVAYLAADIDRCYGRYQLPDHGNLLANIVRWAAGDAIPLAVAGPGLIDCHLYRQESEQGERLILHLVNLTLSGTNPLDELIPMGPYQVTVQLGGNGAVGTARALVAEADLAVSVEDGWARFTVPAIADHEVIVIHY